MAPVSRAPPATHFYFQRQAGPLFLFLPEQSRKLNSSGVAVARLRTRTGSNDTALLLLFSFFFPCVVAATRRTMKRDSAGVLPSVCGGVEPDAI